MKEALCFLAAFGFFLAGASPTVSFEDTGELIYAARCLGVTHPPGYPWLTMLGSLFLHLPAGDPAFRLNAMSALFGALAVTAVFEIAWTIAGESLMAERTAAPFTASPTAAALIAAIALATSKTLWWQAGIAEKYTLSLVLMCLTLQAMLSAWLTRRPSMLVLSVFLAGLALSHHLHGLYLLPILGWLVWKMRPAVSRTVILAVLFMLPLLSKGLAVPIRAAGIAGQAMRFASPAAADPGLNWGQPDRADRWYYYLAARQYRSIMLAGKGPGETAGRAARQVAVLPLGEFGPVLAFAAPGLAALNAVPGLGTGTALVLAANMAFAVSYDTPEIERYYLLSYAVLAVLIGLGGARLILMRRALWLAVLAALAVPAIRNGATSPRDRHYLAWDFAVNQMAPLPPGGVLICEGDDQAFPLFYARYVARFREDTALLPMPFACWKPSYERLGPQLPGLILPPFVPDPGRHLPGIIAANPARPFYYTPGCSGRGSERFLVPRGVVFAAFPSPQETVAAASIRAPLPRLRLRGAVDSARYQDPVSLRAVRNYGMAFAFHGAQALEFRDYPAAERDLSHAVRLPMETGPLAAALTHLALIGARTGKPERCEPLYRRAIELKPDFAPALLGLGKLLIIRGGDFGEARRLLIRAARSPAYLNPSDRRELAALLGKIR